MATSESEDFESADEEFEPDKGETKPTGVEKLDCQDHYDDRTANRELEQKLENLTVSCNATPKELSVDNSEVSSCDANPECDNEVIQKVECSTSDENKESKNDEVFSEAQKPSVCPVKQPEDSQTHDLKPEDASNGTEGNAIRKNRRHERPNRKPKESKIGQSISTKKLGTRVTTNVITKIDSEPESSNAIPKDGNVDAHVHETNPVEKETVNANIDTSPNKEEFTSVFDKLAKSSGPSNNETTPTQGGGWGWGSWGSSLLSTATASVSTLTSHVSQGLSTVIDTVEGGLGAPDPEELARQDLEAEKIIADLKEPCPEEDPTIPTADVDDNIGGGDSAGLFPLGQLMSGVSHLGKMVENTGVKVLSGGLDTLEVIGKKTMAVLQDGDPGLKKKRALFTPDGPILSQALREAKDKAEEEAKLVEEKQAARKVHFETLFDDYQGLIHLEALEMLGRQCEMKLQSSLLTLEGSNLVATQERLQAVRDECLLPDPDDIPDEPNAELEDKLSDAFSALPVSVTADKLLKVWESVQSGASVRSDGGDEAADTLASMHERAIAGLAQLTASCVEQFHRAGELLLVHEQRNPQQEASHLMQITLLESSMIEQLASSYCEALNTFGEPAQPVITKVFFEASNSSTYIQDAFQLLVPVLQVGAV